jgi:hypothetical protein
MKMDGNRNSNSPGGSDYTISQLASPELFFGLGQPIRVGAVFYLNGILICGATVSSVAGI